MKNIIFRSLAVLQVLSIVGALFVAVPTGDWGDFLGFQLFFGMYQLIEGGLNYLFFWRNPAIKMNNYYFLGVVGYFLFLFLMRLLDFPEFFFEAWLLAAWFLGVYHIYIQITLTQDQPKSGRFLPNISF